MEGGDSTSVMTGYHHLSIQIMNEEDLATTIRSKMESNPLNHSLCRVSEELLRENGDTYHPSLVSIGPLHHGRLNNGECHKWWYFHTLLTREPDANGVLNRCINALKRSEQKARNFYSETINMGSDKFVEMMLIDGGFIIELFLEDEYRSLRRRDDLFFSRVDKKIKLMCDLILLENQLPFFVLELLFHLVPIPKQFTKSLIHLALNFFRMLIPKVHPHQFCPKIHHLLDLIRLHFLPTQPWIPKPMITGLSLVHIQCATQLHTFGIKLERGSSESPLDITFVDGKLKIPPLKIHGLTKTLLGNLIAMEHCQPECPKIVTSYAIFMEQLMQFKRDARLLQEKDILLDGHYQEAEIVILFKKLLVHVNAEEFYYKGVCDEVQGYKASKGRVQRATLQYVYHRTHFGIAGFSLAMLLLVFLFTGVLFSVLNFLLHHFQ